jgi:hypothetical protein
MHSSSATQELLTEWTLEGSFGIRLQSPPHPTLFGPGPLSSFGAIQGQMEEENKGTLGGNVLLLGAAALPQGPAHCRGTSRHPPLPPKLPIPGQRTTQDQLAGHGEPLGSMRLPPPLAWAEEGLVAAWISLLPWGGADLAGPRLSSGPLQFCPSGML